MQCREATIKDRIIRRYIQDSMKGKRNENPVNHPDLGGNYGS